MRGVSSVVVSIVLVAIAVAAAVLAYIAVEQTTFQSQQAAEIVRNTLAEHNMEANVDWCLVPGDVPVCQVVTSTQTESNQNIVVSAQVAYVPVEQNGSTLIALYKLSPPIPKSVWNMKRIYIRELSDEEANTIRNILALSLTKALCIEGTNDCYLPLAPTYSEGNFAIYYAALVTIDGNTVILHV